MSVTTRSMTKNDFIARGERELYNYWNSKFVNLAGAQKDFFICETKKADEKGVLQDVAVYQRHNFGYIGSLSDENLTFDHKAFLFSAASKKFMIAFLKSLFTRPAVHKKIDAEFDAMWTKFRTSTVSPYQVHNELVFFFNQLNRTV